MTFIRNIWYVAGHSDEMTDKPLGRTYLNEPVVIFRTEGGSLVALDDRCSHRLAPLHQGTVIGESIRCAYHGLRFDKSGHCSFMPIGGESPPRARQKPYPVAERHALIWIWMGDEALADPDLIPDLSDRCSPGTAWFTGVLHAKANYQLLVDNLLDLSHAEFLHPFLSSDGWAGRNKQVVKQSPRAISVVNTAENDNVIPVMKSMKPNLRDGGRTVQVEEWNAPSLIRLSVEYYVDDDSLTIPSAHLLTPETDTTTHYFLRGGQTVDPTNDALTEANRTGVLAVFQNEDIPLIEAQQRYLGDRDLLEVEPAILSYDKAAIMARRLVAKLIREENAQRATEHVAAE